MAVYRGKIDLVDMREIAQASSLFTWIRYAEDIYGNGMSSNPEGKNYIGMAYNKATPTPSDNPTDYTWTLFKGENGVGIVKIETYYAYSDNGTFPPADIVSLTLLENGILAFPENGSLSFIVNNSSLKAQGEYEQLVNLNTSDNKISSAGAEWTETIPEVPPGYYLWTKTIYYYSDGSTNQQYLSSYHGQNGLKGQDANQFKLKLNQTEIVKFVDNQGNFAISPNVLTISIVKDDTYNSGEQIQIQNLDESKFLAEIYDIKTGKWLQVSKFLKFTYITEKGEIEQIQPIITIDELFNFNIDLQSYAVSNTSDPAATLLATEECILRVSYTHVENNVLTNSIDTYILNEFLNIRYGMTKDMASLSIKANGIVASMQDSKLTFNAEGLEIINGSFKIKDKDGTDLFYTDENGNLSLMGNVYANDGRFKGHIEATSGTFKGHIEATSGTFKGHIEAESGTFKGSIEAEEGKIGGFIIEAGRLRSKKVNAQNNSLVVLDGQNGLIEAENIILGTGAQIRDYIVIGDFSEDSQSTSINRTIKLQKPKYDEDSFIEVKKDESVILSLNANGTINVGNGKNKIIIDGAEASMMSQGYIDDGNFGWKITNNNSVFNNVTVRGSIRASVLEYGEVQTIGGALLVRPGTRIQAESYDSENDITILTVEEIKGFRKGDYCRIDYQAENSMGRNYYIIQSIVDKQIFLAGKVSNDITSESEIPGSVGKTIVSFGQYNETIQDNIGIFVNGSYDENFMAPQAISVFETDYSHFAETNQLELVPRIVLGKLPAGLGSVSNTYGLFAENVYLKGALVTQTSEEKPGYSGINTIYTSSSEQPMNRYDNYFKDEEGNPTTGPILLWAGAEGIDRDKVENAPFFVDRNGNLFANSGYFKGTIITDATITASIIETAVLRGSNTAPNEAALTIEDATKGICFTAKAGDTISTVFEVTKDYIAANVPSFNFNNNFKIKDSGALVLPSLYVSKETSAIALGEQRISYLTGFNEEGLSGALKAYIDFGKGLSFSPTGSGEVLILSQQEVRAKEDLYIEKGVRYNELVEYRPAYEEAILIGYDLYIEE